MTDAPPPAGDASSFTLEVSDDNARRLLLTLQRIGSPSPWGDPQMFVLSPRDAKRLYLALGQFSKLFDHLR
jgi:hypothetical protein